MSLRKKCGVGYGLMMCGTNKTKNNNIASKGLCNKDYHITVKKVWNSRFNKNLKKIYVKALLYDHGAGVF